MSTIRKSLITLMVALLAVGSGTALADRDSSHGGGSRDALSFDLLPGSQDFKGKGYGQYIDLAGGGGVETVFNANVRLALLSPTGVALNTSLGITLDNAPYA